MPDTAALTVLAFLGEQRGFDWIRLDASLLPTPFPPRPTPSSRPNTRITPTTLHPARDPRDQLREHHPRGARRRDRDPRGGAARRLRRRGDTYRTPERRALDRIAFPTTEEAAAAKARLDAGEIDFDALAAERGLKPEDIDQGIVAADRYRPRRATRSSPPTGPGIVGPLPTPLGPALYRINAIMPPRPRRSRRSKTDLAKSRQLEAAKKQIHEDTAHVEDLIAGGATLEEIASETVMQLGSIALNSESKGGLADDAKFREAAAKAEVGEETDLAELTGGGLATLRVDKINPPAVIPLAEIRDRVAADWTATQTADALTKLAVGYIGELKAGLSFTDLAARLGRPSPTPAR